jgi:hypothetical protein
MDVNTRFCSAPWKIKAILHQPETLGRRFSLIMMVGAILLLQYYLI